MINSAKEVKSEEKPEILVFFRGVYQLRQMRIEARVGEQHQLGQKVVPSKVIYLICRMGVVAGVA